MGIFDCLKVMVLSPILFMAPKELAFGGSSFTKGTEKDTVTISS